MSSLGSPSPFFLAGKKAYEVERSLRFNRNDNAYLTRTPSSAGNRKTFTFSAWVKLGQTGISTSNDPGNGLFLSTGAGSGGANMTYRITNNGYIGVDYYGVGGYYSTARLRDPSAWYHCVWVMDTTESTAVNRFKVYVNGDLIYNNQLGLSQNADTPLNNNSSTTIGAYSYSTSHAYRLDGYLAEVNFIDGFAYGPSYFAETNATTGQWNPKKYTGSYGTNGFYLNFSDNSATTATTLGKDSSGNSNNFTPNNFVTGDAVKDSPTNNFAIWNIVDAKGKDNTFSEGNLKTVIAYQGSDEESGATFAVSSGKWYWEEYMQSSTGNASNVGVGVKSVDNSDFWRVRGGGGESDHNGSQANVSGLSWVTGDIIGILLDLDDGSWKVSKNGTLIDVKIHTNVSGTVTPTMHNSNSSENHTFITNFGQDSSFAGTKTAQGNTDGSGQGDFYYSVPSGYKALCSANLPDPTILLPNKHFDTVLYTGSGSGTQNITSLNFQPDWVWLKVYSTSGWHALIDSVRGVGKILASNEGDAENNSSDSQTAFSAFLSNGFTVGYNTSWYVNGTPSGSSTQVAWNWNAGDTDGKTYTVTVVSDSGNKYRFDGFGTSAVTLDLAEGGTYIFNMDDASNASHPFMIGTAADDATAPFGSGIVYKLDGVVKTFAQYHAGFSAASTRRLEFTIPATTNNLFYFCYNHNGMGGGVNTNTTLGSSNFDGSIQTTIKTNTSAGFSIITYSGTGADATIGHGLGVTPNVALTKKLSGGGKNWNVKHSGAGGLSGYLDNTDAFDNNHSGQGIISNFSSSSTYSITRYNNEYTYDSVNASGETYVAYVFSDVAGYSKFGSYIGTANSDGPFVFTGFRVAWLLIREVDDDNNWIIMDNKRGAVNDDLGWLYADLSYYEESGNGRQCDFLSNGFKIRSGGTGINSSNDTYIYFAFAESPFKNARAR